MMPAIHTSVRPPRNGPSVAQYGPVFTFHMFGRDCTYLIGSDAAATMFNSKNDDLNAEVSCLRLSCLSGCFSARLDRVLNISGHREKKSEGAWSFVLLPALVAIWGSGSLAAQSGTKEYPPPPIASHTVLSLHANPPVPYRRCTAP